MSVVPLKELCQLDVQLEQSKNFISIYYTKNVIIYYNNVS